MKSNYWQLLSHTLFVAFILAACWGSLMTKKYEDKLNEMEEKIYYQPVVKQGKEYFTVNGAISTDKDEAIYLTKKHISFIDPETIIVRVDEIKE